jgi:hypothetical protein
MANDQSDAPSQKFLSLEEFIQADKVEYATVPVPGGLFRIGSVTAEEWVAWSEAREQGEQAKKIAVALLISRSMVDADGKRIGDDAMAVRIRKMQIKTTEILLKAIYKLNGINQPDEVLVKKS